MAKKKVVRTGETCSNCSQWCKRLWGLAVLAAAVLYLGQDMGWAFASFWKLNWWTSAFLLVAWKKLCCTWK